MKKVLMQVQILPSLANASTARYLSQLGKLEQVSCSRKHNYKSCLTFPNYTTGMTGAMWVKFLLKETTNSTIQESNQGLLDNKPILNHCCCCPTEHIVIIKLNPQNSLNSSTHCHLTIFYLMLTMRHMN